MHLSLEQPRFLSFIPFFPFFVVFFLYDDMDFCMENLLYSFICLGCIIYNVLYSAKKWIGKRVIKLQILILKKVEKKYLFTILSHRIVITNLLNFDFVHENCIWELRRCPRAESNYWAQTWSKGNPY